ncbi:MAG: hypothetical protein NTW21_13850 [Verrucomicrobia bacterium]|nr:hypothetical protein [Verrucomicrobiota bacterium]
MKPPTIFTYVALAALARFATATVTIDWVTVGNINNPADPTTSYGSVDHVYRIAQNETTIAQYSEFLILQDYSALIFAGKDLETKWETVLGDLPAGEPDRKYLQP